MKRETNNESRRAMYRLFPRPILAPFNIQNSKQRSVGQSSLFHRRTARNHQPTTQHRAHAVVRLTEKQIEKAMLSRGGRVASVISSSPLRRSPLKCSFFWKHGWLRQFSNAFHPIHGAKDEQPGHTTFKKVQITCLPGLEGVLKDEIAALLGYSKNRRRHLVNNSGSIVFKGATLDQLLLCHLHLGTATYIYAQIAAFPCRYLDELVRKTSEIPWSDSLTVNCKVWFKIRSSKSRIFHDQAVKECVQTGIMRSMKIEKLEEQVDVDSDEGVGILVNVFRDEVTIWMTTSSTPLYKRGYREEFGKAPLREDIVYAMLRTAEWKPVAPGENAKFDALLDPFCGSGTIPIEAAAIRQGLPPGRLRPAPFWGTKFYQPDKWEKLVGNAVAQADTSPQCQIYASDRDVGAIEYTQTNAKRAGVSLKATHAAFSSTPWFDDPSSIPGRLLIASNLPFGLRVSMSKQTKLHFFQKLAHNINRVFGRDNQPYSAFILLTSKPKTLLYSGLRTECTPRLKSLLGGIHVEALFACNK